MSAEHDDEQTRKLPPRPADTLPRPSPSRGPSSDAPAGEQELLEAMGERSNDGASSDDRPLRSGPLDDSRSDDPPSDAKGSRAAVHPKTTTPGEGTVLEPQDVTIEVTADVDATADVEVSKDTAAETSDSALAAKNESELELTEPLEGFAAVSERPDSGPFPRSSERTPEGGEERSAAAHLRDSEQLDAWTARAEWFEHQANQDPDVRRKGRTLTVASELWAMAGNAAQAARVAAQAGKLNSAVGLRQARQLAASAGDTKALMSGLVAEAVAMPSAEARAHASFYAAEVSRLRDNDGGAALKHWDVGAKQSPSDLRPQLFKLIKQLGGSARPPSLRWDDTEDLEALRRATQTLAVLRGDPAKVTESTPLEPVAAFVSAARALSEGQRTAAADLLLELANAPEFSRAARWLVTALLAPSPDTRARAASLLSELLKEKGSAALRRVLAARALELGNHAAASLALEQDRADENADLAFTPADHIAIAALGGADRELLTKLLEAHHGHEDLRPLVEAVAGALGLVSPRKRPSESPAPTVTSPDALASDTAGSGQVPDALLGGPNGVERTSAHGLQTDSSSLHAPSENGESATGKLEGKPSASSRAPQTLAGVEGRPSTSAPAAEARADDGSDRPSDFGSREEAASLALGNALGCAATLTELRELLTLVDTAAGDHPLLHLIALESALERRDIDRIADALVNGPTAAPTEDPHQAHYAAGLLYERFGKADSADRHYGQALRSPHFGEAAARALLGRLPRERATKLLASLADHVSDPEHKALLMVEAALSETSAPARLHLLEAAQRVAPALVLTPHLAEATACETGELEEQLRWLAEQREASSDPELQALLLVREAFLRSDPLTRASRVRSAWQIWPKDLALGRLFDVSRSSEPGERAALRLELARLRADDVTRTQLLLEAAWLFEEAGDHARAAEAAEIAAETQPLAQLCLVRTAAGQPQARRVREDLEQQVQVAASPLQAAALCLQLSEFEARDGQAKRQLQLLSRAVELAPQHLPSLVALEAQALEQDDSSAVLKATTGLMELLPDEDAIPHTLLAARFERLDNGWNAAYPVLERKNRGFKTPLIIARQLLAHATVLGTHQVAYDMTCALQAKASQPVDKAILSLRAAELSLRLDKDELALTHLRDALAIHPGYLPALALYAQVLTETEHFVRAAETFELLARHSRVTAHRVDHWYAAATLWLDQVGDAERGLHSLQHASKLDPTHKEVFERLRRVYTEERHFGKLRELIDQRLDVTTNRDEIALLQLAKSQALVAAGDSQHARQALLAVIKASPENVQALTSLAELSERDGDALSAEHALLQLVRLNADANVQADVYRRLAKLYNGPLQNPKRALRCYQEVLRRSPDDAETFDAMVMAHAEVGQTERALELLDKKFSEATDEESRIAVRLRAARLQARVTATQEAAEQAFADLLARYPNHDGVLRAAAEFYVATDRAQTVADWRTRLIAAQLAGLRVGKLDGAALVTIELLSDALRDTSATELFKSLRAFLAGRAERFNAGSGRAMSRHLDELLAPAEVPGALRILLMQTRGVLDQALEVNLAPLTPRRIANERVRTAFEVKARAMGVNLPELYVTDAEPCLALVTGNPSRVVLGNYWVDKASPAVLDYLVWRCLKSDQARVGLFTQLDKDRLTTVLLAFLSCFVEVRVTPPIRTLYETTRLRVAQRLPKDLDDDLPVLALEVLTNYREAQPDLADAVRRWVNRAALLATGDLEAAMTALAVLDSTLPVSHGRPNLEQLMKSHHALDLLEFMLDDSFALAYRKSHA